MRMEIPDPSSLIPDPYPYPYPYPYPNPNPNPNPNPYPYPESPSATRDPPPASKLDGRGSAEVCTIISICLIFSNLRSVMGRLVGAVWSLLLVVLPLSLAAQEPVLPIPANVTVDGVPPIPLSLVAAVAPYGQYRRAQLVTWHPTERRILITTSFANVPQLHQVKFPGGARIQLTFDSQGVPARTGAVFLPDGNAFVFEKDTGGGGEVNQLFRYDIATGALTMLTDGKSRNGDPVVSRSGRVAYQSNRRDGKNRELHILNPRERNSSRLLAPTEGVWAPLEWSSDESSLLALQLISSSETYLWKVHVADGQKTLLTPKGDRPVRWARRPGDERAGPAFFAPDGETVYALGTLNGEIARIFKLVNGAWTAITPADRPVETFALSRDGKTLAVVFDAGATSRFQLLDVDGRPRRTPSIPPGVISEVQWHPSRPEVAFNIAGARSFSDVYSVDVTRGSFDRWTLSEGAGGNAETLPDAEIVTWESFDGLDISGVLYRPPAAFKGPRPVIINVHGGPVERERPRAIGRSNYFRSELGIAVIYPNIRGSAGFGRTFEELDNGLLRENAVKDIGALLDWIATQPGLDRRRVMIAGPSYGGFVALAAAIAYGDRLRGVNPAFGITDFPSYLQTTEISRLVNRNAEYGDPADPEMRAFLTRISPLTKVDKIRTPVFIAAGAKDTRVPISQAESLVKELKSRRTPVWYLRFEDAGHQQLTAATNDLSIYTWVMFVRQYLLPEEPSK
jgi:dipeptidyl aminopeptidase/acylaminoacyl peptidase